MKNAPMIAADYRDSVPAWPAPVLPPSGAPNVVMLILDDVGFGQLGCFGSDIRTPNIDALARDGLRYTNFHTTALCSPTRACLLTGRNHHANHVGAVAEVATGYPGYDMRIPPENGTMAEILRDVGYTTLCVGKWHLTPTEEVSMGSRRDRWPLGKGFERFYGFHGAETNQYFPELVYDNHQVDPPATPEEGYHLTEDMVGRSIEFVRDNLNAAPDKPFFLWLGLGACHAPHHAPPEYIEGYRGQFDQGWDAWREEVFARQLRDGVVPSGTRLSERPDWIAAWADLSDIERRVAARMMEVFAGFLEHTDAQIGRLIDELRELDLFENTLFVLVSDNGASPEGGKTGAFNILRLYNSVGEDVDQLATQLDLLGTPHSYGHYPYSWAWAGNTPMKRWKQEAHEGGVACPMVVSWPGRLGQTGTSRHQYVHAIDVLPTLLEILRIDAPSVIRGIVQTPVHGVSFAETFSAPDSISRHRTQYYEVRSCRALYHDGWKAVAYHPRVNLAWDGGDPARPFSDDIWELYHVAEDFAECVDLADAEPRRLSRMKEMWWVEAGKYQVLPLDNRGSERLAVRKLEQGTVERRVFRPSAAGIREHASISLKNRSHSIEAVLDVPNDECTGVILAQGSRFAGWAMFLHDGHLCYTYNYLALDVVELMAPAPLSPGRHTVGYRFDRTGEHQGKGHVLVDGITVAVTHVERTVPYSYGVGGDMLYVGRDGCEPVCDAYAGADRLGEHLRRVTVEAFGPEFVDAEARLRIEDATH